MKGLNISVLVKPVPDPGCYESIQIDPQTGILVREGLPNILNPADKHALEAALQLVEQHSGRVVMVSMAPPNALETVKEGLAMGADEAWLLSDRAFAGADTLATSRVLAAGIKKLGLCDLVLAGSESADGGTAHVPSQVGEILGISHLTNVTWLNIDTDANVRARMKMENGYIEVEGALPMVIGVSRGMNVPRYTSLPGILAAQDKPVKVLGLNNLGLDPGSVGLAGSPTQPGKLSRPELKRQGERLEGEPAELAKRIVAIMRSSGVLS